MPRIEKTVFLSYRRTNIPWALNIFQNLTQYGYDVFFDFTGIASGDFERVILENIRARAHFLVLLTPSALERCGDPDDWLRREIEEALDTERNIVPLMFEGFDFGTPAIAKQLTGKLAQLKQYSALNIPADYFLEAMGRLRDRFLNIALESVPRPASPVARQAAKEQKAAAAGAPEVPGEELTAQQWFERGFNTSDNDEKLRFYNNAIRLKPDYAEAYNNRGLARRAAGDIDGALSDYEEAIRLKPDFAEPFYNRGSVRRAKGDLKSALEDYEYAMRLKPGFAEAFTGRGNARYEQGDGDGALADYNEAIRLNPGIPEAFMGRGNTHRMKGDLNGAIADYNESIRLRPDSAQAYFNRGAAFHEKGDLESALKDYKEAVRLKPDYTEAINVRDAVGKVLAARGKT